MAKGRGKGKSKAAAPEAAPAGGLSATGAVVGGVLAAAAVACVVNVPVQGSVTGPPHPNKPYTTFAEFYPFYQTEHVNTICRQLHFFGTSLIVPLLLLNPGLLMALAVGASAGYHLVGPLSGIPHGFFEAAVVVLLTLAGTKLLTGGARVVLLLMFCGYFPAWVGHFFFEQNKPASFIYPTFSLMSDFYMVFNIATGVEGFEV